MSRYIDADKLLDWIKDSITMYGNTYNIDQLNMWGLFEEQVKNTPTADVEQLVRCKDCKYYKYRENDDTEWRECITTGNITGCNDYCSYGERKEDE